MNYLTTFGAVVLCGGFALADIEVFRAQEVQPNSPTQATPSQPATEQSNREPQPAIPKQAAGLQINLPSWEPRDTSLTLPRDVPVDLQSADRSAGEADIKLEGFELVSEVGLIVQVDRSTWENGPLSVPAAQWHRRAPAHRGSNLYFLHLGKDRYARLMLGTTEVDWTSAKPASPGDIAQPTAFKLVNIRYWLSDPSHGKQDTRRLAVGKFDPRLVGKWKLTRPGGAMIADVPGADNTIITRVGGWSEGDKGTLVVAEDGSYQWKLPDGGIVRGQTQRIRPASPALGQTYWSIDGLGEDAFITFDPAATHQTSDGMWAGNRAEPMAIGGKKLQ